MSPNTDPVTEEGQRAFDAVAGMLDYAMFIVTTAARGCNAGCLVGFTTQVSIQPSRFLIGLSVKNHTYRVASEGERLAVHVLSGQQRSLARLFGEQTGDQVDKFAQCSWHPDSAGTPILDDAPAWFSGPVLTRLPLGDHVGFVIEPDSGQCRQTPGNLVVFKDVADLRPGHDA